MALQRGSEDLLPVYQSCVFRSDARVDSHWHVARELAEHSLSWKRGSVDVAMYKRRLQQIEMYVLRYGAEVDVRPRPFDEFALVHVSLRGAAEMTVDGVRIEVGEGRTALLAPRDDVSLKWHAGTEQLIMKLPLDLLRSADPDANGELALLPAFVLPSRLNSQWDLLVRSLLNVARLPRESVPNPAWLGHFERNVALFLLNHQPDAASPTLVVSSGHEDVCDEDGASADVRRLDAMLHYMQSRLSAPVSLNDLAAAAGVSVRTLNALCHRHLGETPMNHLRNMRLDAVRAKLKLQPGLSITATALDYGFGHHGRFSAYYLKRFGELPRQTGGQE